MAETLRSYGQYCPVARASEILAMRWTPIIVRNMLMGCETFSEIREGAPGIPKSLLAQRLRMLESFEIVERRSGGGRGSRYVLTKSGRELQPVVDAMGDWGARWLDVAPHHIDAGIVLWSMCKLLEPDELPQRRLVVQFEISDAPDRRMWIVAAPPEAEVCTTPPGFDEDLVVKTDTETLGDWHLGRISLGQAMKSRRLSVTGPRHLIRELSGWGMRGLADFPPPAPERSKQPSGHAA
jgi:DNA-binding HxlR family transcriptional regulator